SAGSSAGTIPSTRRLGSPMAVRCSCSKPTRSRSRFRSTSRTSWPRAAMASVHAPLRAVIELGKLAPDLARALSGELALPSLGERAEDLRALVLDGLTRASLRLGREPLGI